MPVAWAGATSTGVTAAPTTGVTVTKPSDVTNKDVLYAFISKTDYSSTAPFTCEGWTEISPVTQGSTTGNDTHVTMLRKVISNAANEPASYTFVSTDGSSRNMVGIICRVTGADNTTPEDAAILPHSFVINDATPASRAGTSVTANALVLQFCQLSLGAAGLVTWVAPSGYTQDPNATNSQTGSSLNNQCGVAYKTQVSAGAVGTNSWQHTPDDSVTDTVNQCVIVRPATYTRPLSVRSRF